MSSAAEEHVLYQIANATLRDYPYAHLYIENIFPDDFYSTLRANWPHVSALTSLADTGRVPKGAYPERFILPFTQPGIAKLDDGRKAFWHEFASWFLERRFLTAVIDKFERPIKQRLGDDIYQCGYEVDSLIVRDLSKYSIGPHTDAPHRLLSMLFYCPDDEQRKHLGTSIYVPRNADFRCKGGPHYPHHLFKKVRTMEYKPNSVFAFIKNDHSFHGVEAITDAEVQRDVLLYDIRVTQPEKQQPRRAGFSMLKRMFVRA